MSSMPGGNPPNPEQNQPQPKFDPSAAHQQTPKLRPVRLMGAEFHGQPMMGIADARQISPKMVMTSPAAQFLLPMLDGKHGLDDIVKQVGRGLNREILEQLVAQLDDAGLIEGPTAQAMLAKVRADFDGAATLPPGSTAALAEAMAQQTAGSEAAWSALSESQRDELGASKLRDAMDEWIAMALKDVQNPAMDKLPKAVVVPHLDYPRGWINYASVWGRLRVADRPDRVIILGTNHFGESSGVCGCDKGYETPLGVCAVDLDLISALRKRLGDGDAAKLFQHRYDHEREHSIELQVPWIQHVFGKDDAGEFPKVFGVLVHDPCVNNGASYDGNGLAFQAFVDAMRDVVAGLPGKTLVVSSADLSHSGQAFGDEGSFAGNDPEVTERRNTVFRHDREMIGLIGQNKPDELIAAMGWQGNPTRWCSIGNIVATLKITQPTHVDMLNYAGAMDEQGTTLVTSVAMAMR
jgi:MEMO1 family protein